MNAIIRQQIAILTLEIALIMYEVEKEIISTYNRQKLIELQDKWGVLYLNRRDVIAGRMPQLPMEMRLFVGNDNGYTLARALTNSNINKRIL